MSRSREAPSCPNWRLGAGCAPRARRCGWLPGAGSGAGKSRFQRARRRLTAAGVCRFQVAPLVDLEAFLVLAEPPADVARHRSVLGLRAQIAQLRVHRGPLAADEILAVKAET